MTIYQYTCLLQVQGRLASVHHCTTPLLQPIPFITCLLTIAACCLQALSALLWRPHDGHSLKPTWNKVHINWGKATMAFGATAVCLGIHVSGVGWPWYLMFAISAGTILGAAYYIDPMSSKKVWPHCKMPVMNGVMSVSPFPS